MSKVDLIVSRKDEKYKICWTWRGESRMLTSTTSKCGRSTRVQILFQHVHGDVTSNKGLQIGKINPGRARARSNKRQLIQGRLAVFDHNHRTGSPQRALQACPWQVMLPVHRL